MPKKPSPARACIGAPRNSGSNAPQSNLRTIEGPRAAEFGDGATSILCGTKYPQSLDHGKLFLARILCITKYAEIPGSRQVILRLRSVADGHRDGDQSRGEWRAAQRRKRAGFRIDCVCDHGVVARIRGIGK